MSKNWGFYCKRCDISSERNANHGQVWLREYYAAMKCLLDAGGDVLNDNIEVGHAMLFDDDDYCEFLMVHIKHEICLISEYGEEESVLKGNLAVKDGKKWQDLSSYQVLHHNVSITGTNSVVIVVYSPVGVVDDDAPKIVGYCRVTHTSHPVPWIQELHVYAGLRRAGVGSLLLDCVKLMFQKLQKEGVSLGVQRSNTNAVNLYKKHGFIRVHSYVDDEDSDMYHLNFGGY